MATSGTSSPRLWVVVEYQTRRVKARKTDRKASRRLGAGVRQVFGRIMRNVSQTKTILVAPFRRTVSGRSTTTPVRDPHQSHHHMLDAAGLTHLGAFQVQKIHP
jgi:hypothetical protein